MQRFAICSTNTSMLLNDNIVINQSKQLFNILTRGNWATSLTRENPVQINEYICAKLLLYIL